MIARDDRAFLVAGGVRERRVLEPARGTDHELIGSEHELRAQTRLQRRVRDLDEPFSPRACRGECNGR